MNRQEPANIGEKATLYARSDGKRDSLRDRELSGGIGRGAGRRAAQRLSVPRKSASKAGERRIEQLPPGNDHNVNPGAGATVLTASERPLESIV